MFMVVGYDAIECCNRPAKVVIKGIYNTMEDALKRQETICNGLTPIFPKSKCVSGNNSFISWIKEINIGDSKNIDIYSIS
jgi:hypothetical protein